MRIWLWKCKTFFLSLGAFVIALGLGFVLSVLHAQKFSNLQGERTFYLYNASSQSLQKQELSLLDVFYIKGESVQFAFSGETETEAERIAALYGGRILFTEEVLGVTSYYGYTPNFSDGVNINGVRVNLHIAFCKERETCVVGSPIIFGGY